MWGDEERRNLLAVLESGQWWYGQRVRAFEAEFAAFQGAKHGVCVTSGSTGLETCLRALGIGAGDEVIIPAYTFVATASTVVWVGATPVFADIRPDTLCIDPEDIRRKITPRTKAIMPVHLGGLMADMDAIGQIAREHGLRVIEDACQAWGSQWNGQGAATLGDCGAFSFQASKNITSAEGGIILTNDAHLAQVCRSLTNCGRLEGGKWYEHYRVGSNLRLTEFQAAILQAQLQRALPHMHRRQRNAAILNEGLSRIPGVAVQTNDPRVTRRDYHLYIFRLDTARLGFSRDWFLQALQAEGVLCSAGYLTPVYKNPMFQPGSDASVTGPVQCPEPGSSLDYSRVCCPVAERVCQEACWLPQTVLLAPEEAMHDIVAAVAKVCDHAAQRPREAVHPAAQRELLSRQRG